MNTLLRTVCKLIIACSKGTVVCFGLAIVLAILGFEPEVGAVGALLGGGAVFLNDCLKLGDTNGL